MDQYRADAASIGPVRAHTGMLTVMVVFYLHGGIVQIVIKFEDLDKKK